MLDDRDIAAHAQVEALIRSVGDRVLAARKEKRLSRRALSELSGVSPRYIAKLEGGDGNVSIGLLKRIALALGTSVEALVSDAPDHGAEARLVDGFRNADPGQRARVLEILAIGDSTVARAQRVCLVGLRGAGKSTLGAKAAAALGAPFIELTAEIERLAGMPLAEIIALYGNDGYRELEATALRDATRAYDRVVLAAAGGIVAAPDTYEDVLSAYHTIWIQASPDEHMSRVAAQGDTRPMAGHPQAMKQLRQILAAREPLYARAGHRLDTSGNGADQSLDELVALIRSNGLIPSAD